MQCSDDWPVNNYTYIDHGVQYLNLSDTLFLHLYNTDLTFISLFYNDQLQRGRVVT